MIFNLMNKKFPSIQGSSISVADVFREKISVTVIFMSLQCLYARAYYKKIENIDINSKYQTVGFLLINSNYNTDKGVETLEEMRKEFPEYKIHYIKDEDKELCHYFKSEYIPQCFILNKAFEIIYEGSIDDKFLKPSEYKNGVEVVLLWDDRLPDEPEITFIEKFLNDYLLGIPIPFNHQPRIGCSIK